MTTFDPETDVHLVRVGSNKHTEHGGDFDDATVLVQPPLNFDTTHPGLMWNRGEHDYKSSTGILEVTMTWKAMPLISRKPKKNPVGHPPSASGKTESADVSITRNQMTIRSGSPTTQLQYLRVSSLRSECPSGGCIGFQVQFPQALTQMTTMPLKPPAPPPSCAGSLISRRLDRGMGEGPA